MAAGRVAWIDHAKGLGILLVALMYAATAYGAPAGGNWLLGFAAWVQPFAIPALFMLSGLFLRRSVFGSVSTYLDRRVLHLLYFFAVWLAIETAFLRAPQIVQNPFGLTALYLSGWADPQTPLWFILELVIFHLATRLVCRIPARRVFAAALLLQVAHAAGLIHTGSVLADRFAANYVFFFAGYTAMPALFRLAQGVRHRRKDFASVFVLWMAVHSAFVALGIAGLPLVSLLLGFGGCLAVISAGSILATLPEARLIGLAGRHAMPVYLGFFLPLLVLQAALSSSGLIADAGMASLVTALGALGLSAGFYRLALATPLRALYVRPKALHLPAARSTRRGGSLLTSPVGEA